MPEKIILPNVRKLFIPDPGYIIGEADLSGADAQVVAWEAEDEDLKAAFRAGLDVHVKNAEDMWGSEFTRLGAESHAYYKKRQECKHTVHGVNYGCTPRTTAIIRGWTVREAEKFHTRWLSLHPGIRTNFHGKVNKALQTTKTVWNKFGYRRVFFDRPDACFTEGLAWLPQSTVALNTFKGAVKAKKQFSWIEWLLQVHDSLVFQFPKYCMEQMKQLPKALEVPVPYDDPLIIPWKVSISEASWGDCEEYREAA